MNITDHNTNGVPYLACDGFAAAGGVVHAFSTRLGGVSSGIWSSMNLGTTRGDDPACVRENYHRFFTAVGADETRIVMSNQIHSSIVRTVTSADVKPDLYAEEADEADGLVTDVPGVALVVFSADCLPVLLYDPVRRVAAAVHAGWRGTAAGIVECAVEKMTRHYGCRAENILAAIGPGISACCFETHEDVPDAMKQAIGSAALPLIRPLESGKFLVDLKGINAVRLTHAGLARGHIAVSGDCTACLPEKYWSHRVTQGRRGSQIAVIQLL
ncbi:MAG: peptidoglycan editing factor PgeF [Intestinimonas sp.]|jgi:YfiH family protein|nr:peptidoglycan editing factor PgeF [Intestinimonas sp.]